MESKSRKIQEEKYFQLRNVNPNEFISIPDSIKNALPIDKKARILDIGCGLGSFMVFLKNEGYENVYGIDISDEAYLQGQKNNLKVSKIEDILNFNPEEKFDFFYMNHVLEHIEKDKIIPTLTHIYENLLTPTSKGLVIVPNAQSNTGSYWAFEDFTHSTLFTSGSLLYVLKSAGFCDVIFLDRYGYESSSFIIKNFKKIALSVYRFNKSFWNRITASSYHKPSPEIFTFEIKALISKI